MMRTDHESSNTVLNFPSFHVKYRAHAQSTVHDYFTRWNYDGTIEKIHYALYVQCRAAAGREASPSACVIDSQSVKSAEKGGPASIHPGMTQARRSRVSSGISWSTR